MNDLTNGKLTNNELIMLDALAYYSELSDKYIKKGNQYFNIGNFVDDAIKSLKTDVKFETCFNKSLSDEKNGMVDILNLVKQNPRLTRLEIVYPDGFINEDEQNTDQDNDYKWRKEDTSSVCLVDPVTKNV